VDTPKYTPKDVKRFWSKVTITANDNLCWEWIPPKTKEGYANIGIQGKTFYAHRVAWELINDTIPDGLFVLHKCDNRGCVNPKHLFLGTTQDNMDDMVRKGRSPKTAGELNGFHKLTAVQVAEIRSRYEAGGISMKSLGKEIGISAMQVHNIVSRKHWK
jgi:hypothetical protein